MKDLIQWWKDHDLCHPLLIVWRVLLIIPILFFGFFASLLIFCGWGREEALRTWRSLYV